MNVRLLNNADESTLSRYFLSHELACTHQISYKASAGIERKGSERLREGDYYGYLDQDVLVGVAVFYNDHSCFVHADDPRAADAFAPLIAQRKQLLLMQGAPLAVIDRINILVGATHKAVFIGPSDFYVFSQDTPIAFPKELSVKFLSPLDRESFARATEIYNKALDEDLSVDMYQKITGEMRGAEGVLLAYWKGVPCATAAVRAETPHYHYLGSLAVTDSLRGYGIAPAIFAFLSKRARDCGKTAIATIGRWNKSPIRALGKLKPTLAGDYHFIWYE